MAADKCFERAASLAKRQLEERLAGRSGEQIEDDEQGGHLPSEPRDAALRRVDALKQRIENDHAQQSRAKAKRQLFDQLDAAHDFELPPRMVDAEFNQIWRQIEQDRAQGRLDPSDEGKSDDELKKEYRDKGGLLIIAVRETHSPAAHRGLRAQHGVPQT